jgi:hypothetical protein
VKQVIATAVVAFVAAFGVERPAFAQADGQQKDPPRADYPVVFGGATVDPKAKQWIDLSVSVAQTYDDNLVIDAIGPSPVSPKVGGWYTSLIPQLTVGSKGTRFQFNATGGSNLRYYNDLHTFEPMAQNVGVGFSAKLTQSTTLFVNQAAGYAPAYLYGLFATTAPIPSIGAGLPGSADYLSSREHSYTFGTTVAVTHSLSSRASLSFTGDYQYTGFVGGLPGYLDLNQWDLGGRWIYALNRYAKVRLGYVHRQARYSEFVRPIEHDVEIGIDYARPLSRTRKSTVGFSVGPMLVSGTFGPPSLRLAAGTQQYRIVGDAFIDHQMGRTWYTRAAYRRGLGYIQGLAGPVYTSGATAEAGGFLNYRTDLLFLGGYAVGEMATPGSAAPFTTYTGDARLRIALTREWAAYFEGLLYSYSFDPALVVVPGLPRNFRRNSVRAGLTLWLPLRTR